MDDAVSELLQVEHVHVRYGSKPAVDDVNLAVRERSSLAILGPSGCGKSTLLRVVAGLEPDYRGRVCLRGRDLRGVPAHRRLLTMVFQDGQLFDHLSVARNAGYGLAGRGLSRAEQRSRVGELLEMVGLSGMEKRRPASLSGGERQRVALVRALAPRPELVLLDEPFSALDRALRERLAGELRDLLDATGTTALLVTHDHDEALTIGDRMAVMREGRIVQEGVAHEVWRRPADAGVARFLGATTVLEGGAAARVLAAAERAGVDVTGGRPAQVALRRSAFRVASEGVFEGEVLSSVAAMDAQRLVVQVPDLGRVDALGEIGAGLEPGVQVRLRVDPDGLCPLPQR